MIRFRTFTLSLALAGLVASLAAFSLTAQEKKPDAKSDAQPAPGAKAADLTTLREAVDAASRKGANVDEISKALDAFAKAAPNAKPGSVPPELQALRDAVDAAARKGENVDAISKELLAVEMAVAGKSLTRPRPEPARPNPGPNPRAFPAPDLPFPNAFPRGLGQPGFGGLGGGVDMEMFNKAADLYQKALDLMVKNPNDPAVIKEAEKLQAEAMELMLKAVGNLGAGGGNFGGLGGLGGLDNIAPLMRGAPELRGFPGLDRAPERPRLGIRMERVPAVAAEQLGLDPNTGISVTMVVPDSPAEKAGLKVHDIILEFAGKKVSDNLEDFIARVNEVKAGAKVDMVVLRKGKKVELKGIELPEAAKQPAQPGRLPLKPLLVPNLAPALPPNPAALPKPARPIVAPAGFNRFSYSARNDTFTLSASKGETRYVLTGTLEDGRPKVNSVTVEDGGKTHKAESLDKLGAAYKADAEELLDAVRPRD